MARGMWEDFTYKSGFADGEQVDSRDFEARDMLVSILNVHPIASEHYRYEAYNRPGLHNSCMILVYRKDSGEQEYCVDHECLTEIYEELIEQAYETVASSKVGD
jgi:hypothetical protein